MYRNEIAGYIRVYRETPSTILKTINPESNKIFTRHNKNNIRILKNIKIIQRVRLIQPGSTQ